MELKRILARDTRTATDRAMALYGPDVLVISNNSVNGQTELVVAVDLPAQSHSDQGASALAFKAVTAAAAAIVTPAQPDLLLSAGHTPAAASFQATLANAQRQLASADDAPVPEQGQVAGDARDYLRSREIVDLVRDELSALRREFRISQQASHWQSHLHVAPGVQPLVEALNEAAVPHALRALLVDTLKDHSSMEQGLSALREQLLHTLARPTGTLPLTGVHLLAGPSGSGKTLMTACLAQQAAELHGAQDVVVISYQDMRAGAWSQTQMLCAQMGVECFRSSCTATLRLLLGELSTRRLILIDTPGVEMNARIADVLSVAPDCACHAVIPADASTVTLQRVMGSGTVHWASLMLSKLDEASQPWPLLHLLIDNPLALSAASDGSRTNRLAAGFSVAGLVDLALTQLQALVDAAQPPPAQPSQASALSSLRDARFGLRSVQYRQPASALQ